MTSIGEFSFSEFKGKMTIAGLFPLLENIGSVAFHEAGSASSAVAFDQGLPALTSFGTNCFGGFKGKMTIGGAFPLLENIEPYAFYEAGSASSAVAFDQGLPALTSFGVGSFREFKGKMTIAGAFPLVENIAKHAFYEAGSASSAVAFDQGLPALTSFGFECFYAFEGELTIGGAFPRLENIERHAFQDGGSTSSAITFPVGLPRLVDVSDQAFQGFWGTVTFGGKYPALRFCILLRGSKVDKEGHAVGHAQMYIGPPDSVMLTRELYALGRSAYVNATCIPDKAFYENEKRNTGRWISETAVPRW